MRTHAALPVVTTVRNGIARVLVGGRDDEGRGQSGFVDLSLHEARVVDVAPEPVVRVGALGTFDDRGALPSCVLKIKGRWFFYYTGVQLGQTVPFYYAVGVAVSDDGERFEKISEAPVLDRNDVDPFLVASPCVLEDEGRYRMWYMSGVRWTMEEGRPKHYYHIRYAESNDGLNWRRDGHVCIDFQPGEYAIARPSVVRDGDTYRMWFPYRGDKYKIGYAESRDGLTWARLDERVTFDPAQPAQWEDQMQCYPWIFDANGERFMAYNGNAYGLTGFGLGRLER